MKRSTIKTGVQRALHCRCGREKILALGLCATCYTLKRQDDEYLADYASKFWSGTITAAESAEHPDAASALLLSITACQENRYCT